MTNFDKIEEAVDSFILTSKMLGAKFNLSKIVKRRDIASSLQINLDTKKFMVLDECILYLNGKFTNIDVEIYHHDPDVIEELYERAKKYDGDFTCSIDKFSFMSDCELRFGLTDDIVKFILNDLLEVLNGE